MTDTPRQATDSATDSRSAETRLRLLRAGVRVFAELGFEPATTRQLASQAGVNLAAIPYHFESKRGLYLAVAEHVATQLGARLLPAVSAIRDVVADTDASREELRAALHALLGQMAEMLMGDPEADAWAAFILREQANPTDAFEILYARTMGPLFETIIALTTRLTGRDATDPEARLDAVMLVGQLLVFRTSRAGITRALGWEHYSREHVELVKRAIARKADMLIDSGRSDDD